MPTTISGFKDHPLYALERHLKRDEIIHPMKDIGKFRGEPVFPRANVLPLKSAENWMRSGRKVRSGCQAMKQVKQHAATLNRQREIEMAKADGGTGAEGVMQGMYALSQTELYRPPPVVNVSDLPVFKSSLLTNLHRVRYLRTTSTTSISTFLRCYLLELFTFHVRMMIQSEHHISH
jgi:hypothetical protein